MNYEKYTAVLRRTPFPSHIPATVIGTDYPPFKGADSIAWKACQESFGELPNHHYIMAEKSSHYIYTDNPALVASEIIKLYRKTSPKAKPS